MTTVAAPAANPAEAPAPVNWPLLVTLLATSFTTAISSLVVAPAYGIFQEVFQVSARDVSWVFTIYVIGTLIGLPLMSKLSDLRGRRPIFLIAISLFGLGCVVCALAPSFPVLLLGRALQAFGASSISPVAAAISGDSFPRSRQGFALGLTGTMWAVAGLLGPAAGGYLLQNVGWQAIFLMNLPLVAIVFGMAWFTLPHIRPKPNNLPFDVAGLVLLITAVISLSYGLSQIDASQPLLGFLRPQCGGLVLLALALGAAWLWVESRVPAPIVRLSLLRRRQVALINVISGMGGVMTAAVTLIPSYAALLLGLDIGVAALMSAVPALVQVFVTPLSGRLVDRLGSRWILMVAAVFSALGLATLGVIASNTPSFIVGLMLLGIGFSAVLGGPIRYVVIRETRPEERAIGNAITGITAGVGIAVGLALSGAILTSAPQPLDGYHAAYVFFAGAALVSLLATIFLKTRRQELATVDHPAAPAPSPNSSPTPPIASPAS